MTVRITEIFYSLQGEAATAGLPTTFVRLTGCPLRCGYCDTAYAFSGGEVMPVAAVLSRVADFPARRVTVAGGEPLARLLRKGNAGSNTSADHITVLDQSLASLPPQWRPDLDIALV